MDHARTAIIFFHLVVFAFAITKVYRSDYHFLFRRPEQGQLHALGQQMLIFLALLWVSGVSLIYIDTGFALDSIVHSQKLVAKLACVTVLTLNALVIHLAVFQALLKDKLSASEMYLVTVSGAVSTSSWTFAGFLGVAKPMVKHMSLADFLVLYVIVVMSAVLVAIMLTPAIARHWAAPAGLSVRDLVRLNWPKLNLRKAA